MRFNPHAPDWHTAADIPRDITLLEYAAAWLDMAPHVGHLQDLARGARTVVEFGVRGGVSTWSMLSTMDPDGWLVGVDIDPHPPTPPAVRDDARFVLLAGDSATVAGLPAQADLVMIDSSHEFTQTVLELVRAAAMRPAAIALHDYLYGPTPHVRWAVDGFVADPYLPENAPPYRLDHVWESRWGLAVLRPR